MHCYLDQATRELVGSQGRKLLTRLEYGVVERLLLAKGEPVSKDDLIEFAYPDETVYLGVTDNSLTQVIARVRRKLNLLTPAGSRLLKNVHGVGYTLLTHDPGTIKQM